MNRQRDLLKEAYAEALNSPDPSTQNGAILWDPIPGAVVAAEHNRFPDGVEYTAERWKRPGKYAFIEHAERGVIYKAARLGIITEGLTLVTPWAACADCCRSIIQAGISTLITHKQAFERSPVAWLESIEPGLEMLAEAGVKVRWFDGEVGAAPLLHSGQVWRP